MDASPAQYPGYALYVLILAALGGAVSALAIVAVWHGRHKHRRSIGVAAVAAAVVLLLLSLALGYTSIDSYVRESSWYFSYSVDIKGNGTAPEAVVVPAIADDSLLSGLSLTAGTANWSLVDTEHGRALYVRFTGQATISVEVARYPPPTPLPDAQPTMTNATYADGSAAEVWVFYPGSVGVYLVMSGSVFLLSGYVHPGWELHRIASPPRPLA